jgi:Acetyltransferase (GNAT) domain
LAHPYSDPAYAAAFGCETLAVPEWGTPVLVRPIAGTSDFDACGCYPLAVLEARADIRGGLARLRRAGAVSVVLVPDPLHGPPEETLRHGLPLYRPYKTHFLFDRSLPRRQFPLNHRKNIERAWQSCEIVQISFAAILQDWIVLYRDVVRRQQIRGIANFSDGYFAALASLPQLTALVALRAGKLAAASVWMCSNRVAYYHLGASSPEGYEMRASFGLIAAAIDRFPKFELIHLGGSPGMGADDANEGLRRFKRGFANREVMAYLGGAVLDQVRYDRLAAKIPTTFFPAYRNAL